MASSPTPPPAPVLPRRRFAQIAAFGASAGLILPRSLRALTQEGEVSTTVFAWRNINDRARVAYEFGGNALVVASGTSAMLVDCKNAGYGPSLLAEARSFAGPLSFVVNTHHHADHTGGNPSFRPSSRLLAHARAEPRILAQFDRYVSQIRTVSEQVRQTDEDWARKMRDDASPFLESVENLDASDFGPNDLIDNRGRELRIGEMRAELIHVGAGHTDNDVIVHVVGMNLIHAGDLIFHRLHPYFDAPAGANTNGWIRSLNAIAERCTDRTTVVPGHGEITDAAGVRGQIEYFRKTQDAVGAAIKEGRSRDEIVKLNFPHFAGLGFENLKERLVGAIYDEISGQR